MGRKSALPPPPRVVAVEETETLALAFIAAGEAMLVRVKAKRATESVPSSEEEVVAVRRAIAECTALHRRGE